MQINLAPSFRRSRDLCNAVWVVIAHHRPRKNRFIINSATKMAKSVWVPFLVRLLHVYTLLLVFCPVHKMHYNTTFTIGSTCTLYSLVSQLWDTHSTFVWLTDKLKFAVHKAKFQTYLYFFFFLGQCEFSSLLCRIYSVKQRDPFFYRSTFCMRVVSDCADFRFRNSFLSLSLFNSLDQRHS